MSKPWIKLWVESLDNEKTAELPLALEGAWSRLLKVAERFDKGGVLPDAGRCALMSHTDKVVMSRAIKELVARGLLDERDGEVSIHDWRVWQAGKPSDEPSAVYERLKRHRMKRKQQNDNALSPSHDNVITPDNALSRVESESESESESEKRIDLTPAVLSQSSRAPARVNVQSAMVGALMSAVGIDPAQSLTKAEGARYGKAASEIIQAGGVPEEADQRARNYALRFTDAPLTISALASHWGECATPPPAKVDRRRPVTYNEQKMTNTVDAFGELDRQMERANGVREIQGGDEASGRRVRAGRNGPAAGGLLGPSENGGR